MLARDELVHMCRASRIAYLRPQVARPRLRRLNAESSGGKPQLEENDEEEEVDEDDAVDVVRFYDSARDGPDSPLLDEREHAQAYMWIDARRATAYVAFRGTRGIADLMADADLRTERLAPFPQAPVSSSSSSSSTSTTTSSSSTSTSSLTTIDNHQHHRDRHDTTNRSSVIYVHKGFQDQFCAVERKLTADLAARADRFDRLVVTGHSLGGALATLAAVVYAADERIEKKEVWCYTFGCPRVGDEAFVELFRERIPPRRAWRVFDYADPVPMVPLSPRYAHVEGSGVRLGEAVDEGEVDVYCPSCADVPWPLRLPAGLCALELPNPIAPHGCDLYVRKVEALRQLLLKTYV